MHHIGRLILRIRQTTCDHERLCYVLLLGRLLPDKRRLCVCQAGEHGAQSTLCTGTPYVPCQSVIFLRHCCMEVYTDVYIDGLGRCLQPASHDLTVLVSRAPVTKLHRMRKSHLNGVVHGYFVACDCT